MNRAIRKALTKSPDSGGSSALLVSWSDGLEVEAVSVATGPDSACRRQRLAAALLSGGGGLCLVSQ